MSEPEIYGDFMIWHAPSPDGNPETAWRWERKGAHDPDEGGSGPTRDSCVQTIDMLADMDRDLTIEEADSVHRAMVKMRELLLFREAAMVMRNLLSCTTMPRGYANGIHINAAKRWLADYDNRHAPLDGETTQ